MRALIFASPGVRSFFPIRYLRWGTQARMKERMAHTVHLGGRGLLEGGFHTPNHRWAIASLLSCCGRLFGEEDLIQAAQIYLNEGMDCNADGEYAEKSAGNSSGTYKPPSGASPVSSASEGEVRSEAFRVLKYCIEKTSYILKIFIA